MTNSQIADTLELIADLIEFKGENQFRVRAYRNGAKAIRELGESVAAIVADDPARLMNIEGIGKSTAEKCITLVETGELPQLKKLQEEIPASVLDMVRIPGLGPKKAAALYNQLGITTLDQLKAACEEHAVQELKGFAAKTEAEILKGIAIAQQANLRIFWAEADSIAQQLRAHMQACKAIKKMEFAGSYRRGKETVGDLDLLTVAASANEVMDHFGKFEEVAETIARGETKMSVRLRSGFQIDLRVVPPESFGAALQYFTGSKEHNVILRGMAKQQGLKINEYGVYQTEGEETYVAGEDEASVYAALKLPVFPPEMREARGEFEAAEQGKLPKLIELGDIVADLHMHTTETDGQNRLEEMVAAAQERGLKYIAITDHSKRVTMARGLDSDRLLAQWKMIDALNKKLGSGFLVLKGIECDILEKGGMDLPDEVLAQADWVLASVHYGQNQSREQITERVLGAIENPHVTAIAHPTGRLINRRDPYEVNIDAVFAAAKKHGKFLELNASRHRLDLNDTHCAAAKSHGIPIVISTDSHSTSQLNEMRLGILQARRGGLTAGDVVNTRPWKEVKKMIGKQR